ncbi:hypothetical protein K505DRAFT_376025 [Melanomma pulvis-pyrius CBS 109.77]|uniref:HIT-type domain-containing protein n=1 Tax=Melanomma pulvis-pyrius CBS 109.77 TaxID=1314802 RepID=A0A6A6X9L3_9PLEO|nr:hypothetical protein K505DRAFT_376025 [Melanomma pulvis-pyrius CBS 109.77]
MAETLCGICKTEPKKYKCPTCAVPYCSLACFKLHKPTHPVSAASPSTSAAPEIPQPPLPAPPPKYLRQKVDFSVLATNPKFQELLKTHPELFSTLQHVFAATIEPERGDRPRSHYRGGRGGKFRDQGSKWTQKRGDADAMKLLKGVRDGEKGDKVQGAMAEFVRLVEETFGPGEQEGDEKIAG